jgi:hypothetical protein
MELIERSLRNALPDGEAFPRASTVSNFGKLIAGIAPTLDILRLFLRGILLESTPTTAVNLLDEWALVAGLPDPDFPTPTDATELRDTIIARLTQVNGPTGLELEAVALLGGFIVRILVLGWPTPASTADGGAAATASWDATFDGGDASTASWAATEDGGTTEPLIGYIYVRTFQALTDDQKSRLQNIIERFRPLHLGIQYDYLDTIFRAGFRAGQHLLEL